MISYCPRVGPSSIVCAFSTIKKTRDDGPTDQPTDRPTNWQTNKTSYRDVWTHLITHDTCQSILSCLNPTFRDKNFFPRRALGVLWAPPGSPLGIFPKSTPSDSLQMQHVSQEKYIILVSFQNWHSQNSLNPRHIPCPCWIWAYNSNVNNI